MNRVTFLIDGFNLYHSAVDASNALGLNGAGTKWLNIRSLCQSFIAGISKDAKIEEIHYFSALALHLQRKDPYKVARHLKWIKCLKDTGVIEHLHQFKRKTLKCYKCGTNLIRHEEKETDVAISVKLIELFVLDKCDTIVVLTGDTDVEPAYRTAKSLFPEKEIYFMLPFKRHNSELMAYGKYFVLKAKHYTKHQFLPVVTIDGKEITKPEQW
ncbi:NYN domain-containing protein [candidate division KSB1 bacterium]|nr:NYN domain-containing protein [candidate division KSB1 bacterium]